MAHCSPEIHAEYQEILSKSGNSDTIKKIEVKMPDLVGENFGSTCEYVTIYFENTEIPNLELFLKRKLENSHQGAMIAEMQLFNKESATYNHLIKDLIEFHRLKTGSIDTLDFLPKFYHADPKVILLENVGKRGYILLNKRERQDLTTAKMVLKNLATYHAVSYTMISEMGKEAFESKYESCLREALYTENTPVSVQGIFRTAVNNCIEFVKTADEFPEKSKILTKLSEYTEGKAFEEVVRVGGVQAPNLFLVANHGDVWNNNILFHQNMESGELDHLVFVDYQLGRIGSPNMDLNHYLFSSVKPHVRQQHLNELLEFYFKTFKRTVTHDLRSSFEYTFEEFYEDFLRKSPIGFWMFICMNTLFNLMLEISYMETGLSQWMEKNPDRVLKITSNIIEVIQEHFARINVKL